VIVVPIRHPGSKPQSGRPTISESPVTSPLEAWSLSKRLHLYIKYLKQPVTMRLDSETVAYFKSIAEETDIPYQSLINFYLRDCAVNRRKLQMKWAV